MIKDDDCGSLNSSSELSSPALCCPLQAALKKYQMEHKSKGESLEKCQAELKKLRRKSQGSKHPSKYGDKEMQVGGSKVKSKQQCCHVPREDMLLQ